MICKSVRTRAHKHLRLYREKSSSHFFYFKNDQDVSETVAAVFMYLLLLVNEASS